MYDELPLFCPPPPKKKKKDFYGIGPVTLEHWQEINNVDCVALF